MNILCVISYVEIIFKKMFLSMKGNNSIKHFLYFTKFILHKNPQKKRNIDIFKLLLFS